MNDQYLHDVIREAEAAFEASPETRTQTIGRRSFLKLTGLAGGGLALASNAASASRITSSKVWPVMTGPCTRFRRHGSSTMFLNVATARLVRLCLLPPCWKGIQCRARPRSMQP